MKQVDKRVHANAARDQHFIFCHAVSADVLNETQLHAQLVLQQRPFFYLGLGKFNLGRVLNGWVGTSSDISELIGGSGW